MRKGLALSAMGVLFIALPNLRANVVITDSSTSFSVGIGPDGELFDNTTGVGIKRLSDGYDPLAPGSPRDTWGVANTMGGAYADYEDFGTVGITGTTATSTSSTASYTTTTSTGLTVVQNYSFRGPNVLVIATTITNSGPATDIIFSRDVDWDVAPTAFNENTFGGPVSFPVIDNSYYGFEQPDPDFHFLSECLTGCNQTGDLGGGISVLFNGINPGQSVSFNFYYAISQIGEDANGLDSQLSAAGASYIMTTQSSENGAYPNLGTNSAAIGYGPAVPEPSSVALFITALAGAGAMAWRRRRKNV